MSKIRLTRRVLLGSTFSLFAFLHPAGAGPRRGDRGIGGTGGPGFIGEQPTEDRGIGGTGVAGPAGVIGTIRKFGSIIVNGLRIAYPDDAEVEIDGRPASAKDLRLGQVAQCVAVPTASGLRTQRIVVASEVVGPIEAIGRNTLMVLGQQVSTALIGAKGWKKGQWIAVSGLRKLDGTIVASHAQYRDDSIARVAGPVTLTAAGATKIGGLTLINLDAALVGRRVLADVGRIDGAPAAVTVVADPEISAMPHVRQFSIEAYVARTGQEAHFGSGLTVVAAAGADAANAAPSTRAVVTVAVGSDGGLTATSQRTTQDPDSTPVDHTQPTRTGPQSGAPQTKTVETNQEAQPTRAKADAPSDAQPSGSRAAAEPAPSRPAPVPVAAAAPPPPPPPPPPAPAPPPEPFDFGGGGHHHRH